MNETDQKPTDIYFSGGHTDMIMRGFDVPMPDVTNYTDTLAYARINSIINNTLLGETFHIHEGGSSTSNLVKLTRLYESVRLPDISKKQAELINGFMQEFRTKTTGIQGYVGLATEMPSSEFYQKIIEVSEHQAKIMLEMLQLYDLVLKDSDQLTDESDKFHFKESVGMLTKQIFTTVEALTLVKKFLVSDKQAAFYSANENKVSSAMNTINEAIALYSNNPTTQA